MALEIELLLGAEIEFLAIYGRRGEPFYEVFDDCLGRICQLPESGSIYLAPFRRLLIPHSPFGIFYVVEGGRIFVHAVIDLRRSPNRIVERLQAGEG